MAKRSPLYIHSEIKAIEGIFCSSWSKAFDTFVVNWEDGLESIHFEVKVNNFHVFLFNYGPLHKNVLEKEVMDFHESVWNVSVNEAVLHLPVHFVFESSLLKTLKSCSYKVLLLYHYYHRNITKYIMSVAILDRCARFTIVIASLYFFLCSQRVLTRTALGGRIHKC